MNAEQAKALREPFPKSVIGRLPRKVKRDDGSTYVVQFDFIGHAAATDRLLAVDPAWTWEPVALDDQGLPAFDRFGGLWIRLTVAGVTRLGYGDAQGKTGPNAVKEAIGDGIRNAAMRFGVALDLWSKEDLHQAADDDTGHDPAKVSRGSAAEDPWAAQVETEHRRGMQVVGDAPATRKQIGMIGALMAERGMTDRQHALDFVNNLIAPEGPVGSRNDLTKAQASKLIDALNALPIPEPLGEWTGD